MTKTGLFYEEKFELAPLLAIVADRVGPHASFNDVAGACNVSSRTVFRWASAGLTSKAADRAAVALGLHPAIIWPSWWTPPLDIWDDVTVG